MKKEEDLGCQKQETQSRKGELSALGGSLWGKRRHHRIADVVGNLEKDLGCGKGKQYKKK